MRLVAGRSEQLAVAPLGAQPHDLPRALALLPSRARRETAPRARLGDDAAFAALAGVAREAGSSAFVALDLVSDLRQHAAARERDRLATLDPVSPRL